MRSTNVESTSSMIAFRRIESFWVDRYTTDPHMLTMQDAKIIAQFYGSDENGTTPNMARFATDQKYSIIGLIAEIETMRHDTVTDLDNGTLDGNTAILFTTDLRTLLKFVMLVHNIVD